MIFYDQDAADYSSAVTAYCRERIGATRLRSTLHFAARYADIERRGWLDRETFKCLAMNRSNIFFDRVDAPALAAMWRTIERRSPYLVHAHPSTVFALAMHLSDSKAAGVATAFEVFESSGEVLDQRKRRIISDVFGCRVINRYGLAEFGIIAYELHDRRGALDLLDSECWAETRPGDGEEPGRLIVTGLRNRLMPLIRYDTGDLASISRVDGVPVLENLVGRVHDTIEVGGAPYLTHHLQDVLDHRVQGIRDFQFDMRTNPPTLRIVPEPDADTQEIASRVRAQWGDAFGLAFVGADEMVRVGDRAKFRHVVSA
ncbi:hypothetical protein [Mesorhizobium marinum]|uniref:hypothetical protein n=1 Tax=Mesorhizobium marinum TaxID=3228790 RepID=UPI003467491A